MIAPITGPAAPQGRDRQRRTTNHHRYLPDGSPRQVPDRLRDQLAGGIPPVRHARTQRISPRNQPVVLVINTAGGVAQRVSPTGQVRVRIINVAGCGTRRRGSRGDPAKQVVRDSRNLAQGVSLRSLCSSAFTSAGALADHTTALTQSIFLGTSGCRLSQSLATLPPWRAHSAAARARSFAHVLCRLR